jgi:uncharacterized membrane protein
MATASTTIDRSKDSSSSRVHESDNSAINVGKAERLASALGGGALALYGLSRRSVGGAALALAGGGLLYRGVTGHCHTYGAIGANTADPAYHGIHVRRSVTINAPPEVLYQFWRRFENLPRFMRHLESVTELDSTHSHWVAKAPAGRMVEWDAEITDAVENRRIAWRSLPESDIPNAGVVEFAPATGGRGTVVHVELEYSPPGGVIGAAFAKLFGEEPQQQVSDDLRRFKQLIEAGETPTVQGQPHG